MARASSGVARHRRQKKTLKAAKGFFGGRSKLYRTAKEAVQRAGRYSFHGRKRRKRDFRALWIMRISAAAQALGFNYNKLINGLKKASVLVDRKMLAEMAVNDADGFGKMVETAKAALDAAKAALEAAKAALAPAKA
ncbi:MAG: 50S ribosomal protein L20 [Planctomycetota bacterium]